MDFQGFLYTLQTVGLGAGILGAVSGSLGSFAVLRRQSLLGDAVSHAALPGIAFAFLLTLSKAPLVLVLGAAVAGWLGALIVMGIVRATRIKSDAALGLVLGVFFGVGLVLLTYIQRHVPSAAQAGLDRYLLGQAATILDRDVTALALLGGIAVAVLLLFWKEFKLLAFDPDFAASLGFRVRILDVLLTSLLVLAIVIGLHIVGALLMSALLVAPAVAARQWTDRLGILVGVSSLLGALAGVLGAVFSSSVARLPTGPTIVLCVTALVLLSLAFAPNRGLVASWLRQRRTRHELRLEAVLGDLHALAVQHADATHAHSIGVLRAMRPEWSGLDDTLEALKRRGLVNHVSADGWALTDAGRAEAERRGRENP